MTQQPYKGNYLFLLAGLSVLLISHPIFVDLAKGIGVIAINIAGCVALLIAVWTLVGTKRSFAIGVFLAVALLLLTLAELRFSSMLISYSKIAASFVFFVLTLVISFRDVVFGYRIDSNRITGAVCIYFLIGIIWSLGYTVIDMATPGSFNGVNTVSPDHRRSDLIYFSFVTLATLGYGDITPVNPLARSLAYFEAIVGQFYLAILVAGLVTAHLNRNKKFGYDSDPPSEPASAVNRGED